MSAYIIQIVIVAVLCLLQYGLNRQDNSLQVYAWCPSIIAIVGIVYALSVYSTVTQEGYPLEGSIDGYLLWAILPHVIGIVFTIIIYFKQRNKMYEELDRRIDEEEAKKK